MKLNNENYYDKNANISYFSYSQYKDFEKCEAMAMAKINKEYISEATTHMLVGSYVDAYYEGTLEKFKENHPEVFNSRTGDLKANFKKAEEVIYRINKDKTFKEYLSGETQAIFTAKLFDVDWKVKVDSLLEDKIVDLKVVRSLDRVMGKSFVEYWEYDLQMALYSEVVRLATGKELETYLAVATKEDPINIEIIHIPKWRREECLHSVGQNIDRYKKIKDKVIEAKRCETCEYCRQTKVLKEPIDFQLVGFNAYERERMEDIV